MGSEPRFRNLLRSKHMFDMIKFATKAAVGDRKGVTAIEYALIAAVVAGAVIIASRGMFAKLVTLSNRVNLSSS